MENDWKELKEYVYNLYKKCRTVEGCVWLQKVLDHMKVLEYRRAKQDEQKTEG